MATHTFTLRAGITLADAGVQIGGSTYDIDAALAAGGGSIVTTDDELARVLRAVIAPDGLPLLDENSVAGGAAPNPNFQIARRTFLSPTQPIALQSGDIWLQTDAVTGAVIATYEAT